MIYDYDRGEGCDWYTDESVSSLYAEVKLNQSDEMPCTKFAFVFYGSNFDQIIKLNNIPALLHVLQREY